MIDGVLLHPTYVTTMVCETLSCKWRGYAITACVEQFCPHRWRRVSEQDRARRDQADAQEKERMMERVAE